MACITMLAVTANRIEIDEVKVREAAKVGHDWKNPIWRREDGTLAEW